MTPWTSYRKNQIKSKNKNGQPRAQVDKALHDALVAVGAGSYLPPDPA